MSRQRSAWAATFLLSVGLLSAAEQSGQVQFGGLPLPGATVAATQGATKRTSITDQQGNYSFRDLADGVWTLRVEMLCFAPVERELTVGPGPEKPAYQVWALALLPMREILALAGTPAALPSSPGAQSAGSIARSERATGPTRSSKKRADSATPQNTASAFQHTDVTAAPASQSEGDPTVRSGQSSASGNQSEEELRRQASDGFLVNGTANNGASSIFALDRAFGNGRKGATSLYNGDIGLIFDNSMFDARSFSLTGQDTPKPGYNHFTGLLALGGPLKIPRLLSHGPNFVLNYQWTRNRNASTQSALMPTTAERAGDLSSTPNSHAVDPSTGSPFPGNVIPQDRISPQARALLALYPLPNFAGGAGYNYQIPTVGATHQDTLQTRMNETLGRKNQMDGSFAFQSTRADNPNLFGFLDTNDTFGLKTDLDWRHTFGSRFYGIFGVQYSRLALRVTPYFENRANVAGQAGIGGTSQDPRDWGPPNLTFATGIAGLTDAQRSLTRNQTDGVSADLYRGRGRHNLYFGGDVRHQQFNLLGQQDARGTFAFTGAAAGSDIAGFLLGVPDTSSIAFGNADKYLRAAEYDAYVTDDWRVSPVLTVNAGMRWEYGTPITELYGRLVNLDITPGFTGAAPVLAANPTGSLTRQSYPSSLVRPDRRGVEPRVGVSWHPLAGSSLVIRGGYGVYYNTSVYQTIATQMAQQSPLSKSLSVQNSAADPLTLANGFPASSTGLPNTFTVDPNFRVGYAQNWQVSVQRDLPAALLMTASYIGIKGTRGMQEFLPNTYPTGATNPCPTCPAGFAYLTSNGNSTREAGQIQLRRRLHSGFTASAQYTFSKSIDDGAQGGRGQAAPVIAQNWLDLRGERGLSNFDQRHLLNLQVQYSTGMGVHGGTLLDGWRGTLLKDWIIASQITAGSGLPLTPVYLAAVQGTGVTGTLRPDYTGTSVYASSPGRFLNPNAYETPANGEWGNAGRNSITGPAQFTLNASIGRTFRVRDRVNLDLRVDATNALNHVTFPAWNTTVSSPQFGLPTAANAMRSVQTTLRARF